MFRVYDALGTVNGTPGWYYVYTDGREATPAPSDADVQATSDAAIAEYRSTSEPFVNLTLPTGEVVQVRGTAKVVSAKICWALGL